MVDCIPGVQRFQDANPAGLTFAQTLDTCFQRGGRRAVTTLGTNTGITTTEHGGAFRLAGFNLTLDPAATLTNGWFAIAIGPGKIIPNDGSAVILMADEWALINTNGSTTSILKTQRGTTTIIKDTDESRASNTALTNDAKLQFPVLASTKYWFNGTLWVTSGATPDFKWDMNGPASPTRFRVRYKSLDTESDVTETVSAAQTTFAHTAQVLACDGTDAQIDFEGYLQNGVNAGTVALRWAQNTSDVGSTIVRAGSLIRFGIGQ